MCFGIVARVLGVKAAAAEDAEHALRDRGEQFLTLLEHAVDVIAVVEGDGRLVFVSPAVETLLGYTPDDVVGGSIGAIVQSGETERLVRLIEGLTDHPGRSQTLDLLPLRHRDGSSRWVAATLTNPPDQWGDGVVVNMHDVTKQRELEEQLRHDALHDPLTGLWNRPAFAQYAEKACARASRDGSTLALLFVDLDGFKQVNDTLGHSLGDEVLIEVAKRLRTCLRGSEVLARLGGDEFTVLIERVSGIARRDRDRGSDPRVAHPGVEGSGGRALPGRKRGHRAERAGPAHIRRAASSTRTTRCTRRSGRVAPAGSWPTRVARRARRWRTRARPTPWPTSVGRRGRPPGSRWCRRGARAPGA